MLKLENVSFSYGAVPALSGITTAIGPGVHLLLGENGAGKTTLLKLLDSLRVPSSGRIFFNDTDIVRYSHLPSVLSHFSYLDNELVLPGATIDHCVSSHARFYPGFDPALLDANLAAFGLSRFDSLRNLSLGNLRKAQVAYFLSLRTAVTLLDEPTNGMDIESKLALQRILAASVSDTQTVIVSTHNFADLQNMYDGLIVLNRGRLVLNVSLSTLLERVVFAVTRTQPADALYWELSGGVYHAIFEAGTEEAAPCAIDYRLLYTALHTPYAPALVKIISSPQPLNPCNDEF